MPVSKLYKGVFLYFGCLLLSLQAYAQDDIDSLRTIVAQVENSTQKVDALFSLANYYQMRHNDSVSYYVDLLYKYSEETGDMRARFKGAIVLGRTHHAKGNLPKAKAYYYEALGVAKSANLKEDIGWAYLNLGINHSRGFDLDSAVYYVQLAEKNFLAIGQEDDLWRCYLSYARINSEREAYVSADANFRKALELLPDDAENAERGYLLYKAFAYAALRRRFDLLRDVRIMWDEYKGSQQFNATTMERPEHLALYQLVAGEEINIEQVILDAIDYYKQFENGYQLAWCYHDLGELYYDSNNTEKSIHAYEIADQLYTQAGFSSYIGFIRKRLAELYRVEGDFEKSLHYTTAAYNIIDSIKNEESERNLQKYQVLYETEKKEQALKINQLELGQKTQERNIWLGSSILLGLLALLIFTGSRQRLRQKELLANQEAALQEQRIQQLEQEKMLLALSAMIEGQEQERRRIAKDLHDGMGGLLTTIKAHYTTLVSDTQQGSNHETTAETTALIDRACSEVRRISQNMMPAALLFAGLEGALEDLAAQVRTNGLECTLEVVGEINQLGETASISLYRILQEAVNNVLKHAEAHRILLQILIHKDMANVTIEDDGTGFITEEAQHKKSLGLKSIDSRVRYLKGEWNIDSELGEGTAISIQFPTS